MTLTQSAFEALLDAEFDKLRTAVIEEGEVMKRSQENANKRCFIDRVTKIRLSFIKRKGDEYDRFCQENKTPARKKQGRDLSEW